jgi:hypothetical protein
VTVSTTDLLIAIPIVGLSVLVLVRSFRRRGGPCAGCDGGGCGAAAKPSPQDGLVTLGRGCK